MDDSEQQFIYAYTSFITLAKCAIYRVGALTYRHISIYYTAYDKDTVIALTHKDINSLYMAYLYYL